MKNYSKFAEVYDALMNDVNYHKRAEYISKIFLKYDKMPTLLLDVACGTGGFSNQFAKKGIEVIGIDMSEEMLSCARINSLNEKTDVLYLCQKAEELDLYGTVDGVICCMDSVNHITEYKSLCKAFEKISLFLEKDRLFIFDVNTVYKHKNILANNTFVIDQNDIYCIWQNCYDEKNLLTDISLDFFVKEGENYSRSYEHFKERAYTDEELKDALLKNGFEIVDILKDMKFEEPSNNTDRKFYIARKK